MSSLYLVIPEFEPQADSLWTDFSTILVGKVPQPSIVEFSHLQYTQSFFNSSISLRVLFVEELFPDSPILHGARLALDSRRTMSALSTLNSCIFISDRASDNIWFLCSLRSNFVRSSASDSLDRAVCSPERLDLLVIQENPELLDVR